MVAWSSSINSQRHARRSNCADAESKRCTLLGFLISGLVPFFGLLAAVVYRFERDELRRACPRCGKVTKIYDAIRTRCVSFVPE